MVIFLEKGGIESYEFQSAYNQAAPAAILRYLIKAMSEGIPVIASRALVEFICLLPQENSNDDKLKADFRSNWKEFLDNNLNKLDIYLSKGGNFSVVLPRGRSLYGFNPDNLNKIEFDNHQQLCSFFNYVNELDNYAYKSNIKIDEIESILNPDKSISKNIYIVGHGDYSVDIINKVNKTNRAIKPLFASMTYEQYQNLLHLLNKIGCKFLCLNTCYGGGWNAFQMHRAVELQADNTKEVFDKEQLDFPIAIFSVTDEATKASPKIEMKKFFEHLNVILNNKTVTGIKDWIITDPIKRTLSYLTGGDIRSTPLVWFPGTNQFFKAVDADNIVKIITLNSLIELQLKRKNNIDITHEKAILIYPLVVPFNIVINGNWDFPKFIPMVPGRTHNYIKSITASGFELSDLLESLGFYRTSYPSIFKNKGLGLAPRAYFIGSLICKKGELSDGKLNNVLISIRYKFDNNHNIIPIAKFIAKDSNDKYFKIKAITKNPEKLERSKKSENFVQISEIDLNVALLKKIIDKNKAETRIKQELANNTPDSKVLSEVLSGAQSEKTFWKNINKFLE